MTRNPTADWFINPDGISNTHKVYQQHQSKTYHYLYRVLVFGIKYDITHAQTMYLSHPHYFVLGGHIPSVSPLALLGTLGGAAGERERERQRQRQRELEQGLVTVVMREIQTTVLPKGGSRHGVTRLWALQRMWLVGPKEPAWKNLHIPFPPPAISPLKKSSCSCTAISPTDWGFKVDENSGMILGT